MKKTLFTLVSVLGFASVAYALPYYQQTQGLVPGVTASYYIGTSSPATLEYKAIFSQDGYFSNLGGSGTRCVQVGNDGKLAKATAACGSGGGGSGGGTWATTTSQTPNTLINYPLNSTDVVVIGDSASTSAPWYYDPTLFIQYIKNKLSIGTTSFAQALNLQGNAVLSGNLTASAITATSTLTANSATLTNALTVANGGTGQQTFTSSSLLYGNGTNALSGVATTTLTASSPLSLSNPVAKVGGSNSVLTLDTSGTWSGNAGTASALAANGTNCSAGQYPLGVDASGNAESCTVASTGSGSGNVATSTTETAGQLAYWTSSGATPATLGKVATTTLTLTSFPANFAGTLGTLVGGADSTWTWWGLSTTSQPSSSNLLVSNGTNGVFGVATGTVSAGSSAITVTAGRSVIGGALAIDCATAGSGQNGCLSSTDWSTFNNKQATISATWPIVLSGAALSFGWATTSQPSSSNLFVSNGTNGFYGVATTTLTGTANQISISNSPVVIGSSGAVLTLPQNLQLPLSFTSTYGTTTYASSTVLTSTRLYSTNATSTNTDITGLLTFNGVTGATWASFCTAITGGSGLCDGVDATGTGGAGTISTSSTPTAGQLAYWTSSGAWPETQGTVATTTASCSGSASCTPFTVIGSSPITISATGGGGTGLGWASSTPNTNSMYSWATGYVGIGTTTPAWNLTLGSSTAPQLTLTDNSLTNNPWSFRNAGGTLYLVTSSPSTFATSSMPALTILSNGSIGIGTTSPLANFTLSSTTSMLASEYNYATSTSMTIGIASTTNGLIGLGTSATTIRVSAYNSYPGQKQTVTVCSPNGTAGALTWAADGTSKIRFPGGVQAGNTTSSGNCDIWQLYETAATSTSPNGTYGSPVIVITQAVSGL